LPQPPKGATSVLLNVAVTNATSAGHGVVYGAGAAPPATSKVSWGIGQTQANLVVVPMSATSPDVVVDVAGYQTG